MSTAASTTASTPASTPASTGATAQQARRRRILDAAAVLASRGGFEQVQMRAVAERADVALGTLYRYFPSKIHLLVALLASELERAQASDRPPAPGESAADRVRHVLGRTTRTLQHDPHLTEALTRAFVFADASVAEECRVVAGHVRTMLLTAVRGPAGAEHPTDEELATTQVIADVWLAGLVQWVTGRASASDVARSLDVAVRLLLR